MSSAQHTGTILVVEDNESVRDVAVQMLLLRADLPIILATDFTEKRLRDKIENRSDIHCVAKPYDTNKLPQLIAGMLDTAIKNRGPNTPN